MTVHGKSKKKWFMFSRAPVNRFVQAISAVIDFLGKSYCFEPSILLVASAIYIEAK